MSRYPHFIEKTKCNKQPSSIVALAVDCRYEPKGKNGRVLTSMLDYWSMAYWHKGDRGQTSTVSFSGTTPGMWWTCVEKIARHGGCTWVFIDGAAQALALLDFWPMLEDGRIQLTGSDPWEQSSSGQGGGRKQRSYIVIEDPPIVILCRLRGIAGTLKIVDLRNYTLRSGLTAGTSTEKASGILAFAEAMISTLTMRQLGSLQATAGSQALSSFKHKHLTEPIYVHTDSLALSLERSSMFGGRNECGRIARYQGVVHHLDFRSHYPAIMLTERLPTLFFRSSPSPGAWDARAISEGRQCIADVTVGTDCPCVPYRLHYETIFPVGRFRTTLCTPELLLVMKHGSIECWHSAAWYDSGMPLAEFASEWIGVRHQAARSKVAGLEEWAKAVCNSLHGKFGQRSQQWVDCPDEVWSKPYDTWYNTDEHGTHTRYRSIAWYVQRREDMGEHAESCPAISAYVCSLGRSALFNAMAVLENTEILYCDTDSIWTTDAGYISLQEAGMIGLGQPGKLRLVATYDWVDIKGLKWYETRDGVVCAGKPHGTLSFVEGQPGFHYNLGIAEAVRCGNAPTADTRHVSFQREGTYRHGRVQSDGSVKPLEIWQ